MKYLASSYEKSFYIDSQTEVCNVISNTYMVWDIEGEFIPDFMQQAIAYGFREPCFHYQYTLEGEKLYKELKVGSIDIPYFDFSKALSPEQAFDGLLEDYYQDKMIFDGRPLFRGAVAKIESNRYKVIIMVHHICLDGTGFQLFFSNIKSAYQRLIQGEMLSGAEQTNELNPLADETSSLNEHERSFDVWLNALRNEPARIEFGHVTYPEQRRVESEHISLDHQLSHQVKSYCRKNSLTINLFFKGIYALLVSRISNQPLITMTSPMDRRNKNTKQTIGCFVNTRLDIFDLNEVNTLDDYWLQIKQFSKNTKAFGDIPYMELIHYLKQNSDQPELMVSNVSFGSTVGINETQSLEHNCFITQNYSFIDLNTDIQLLFCESSRQSFNFRFDYLKTYEHSGIFKDFLPRLRRLVEYCISLNQVELSDLPFLTPRDLPLQEYQAFPQQSLAQLVHQWVGSTPEAIALVNSVSGEAISYQQLHSKISDVAHYLTEVKARKPQSVNPCVAINLTCLTDTVVSILATQYLGLPFTCVDCSAPLARQQFVMTQLSPMVLIGEAIALEEGGHFEHLASLEVLPRNATLFEPCHVTEHDISQYIFTSGTTGQPKAVELSHRAFVSTLYETSVIPVGKNVLYSANEAFDAASLQMWLALLHGRTLVIPGRNEIANPDCMERLINDHKVDHLFLTTGLFETYMASTKREMFNDLQTLTFGGDAVSKQAIEHGMECNIQNLLNLYGPTETAIFVTSHRCSQEDLVEGAIPIGKPRPNAQVWIVDDHDRLLGPGMVGHIIVSGPCLAEGYVGAPGQNDKFCERVIKGCNGDQPQTIYRTGDFGYFRQDGVLIFRGRRDDQIKLRGYRIELSEIRQALEHIPEVQMATVILKEKANNKQLLGYYQAEEPIDVKALRKQLHHWLPSYMVPAHLIHVEEMPLNRNGKIDKQRLPEPVESKEEQGELTQQQRVLLQQVCKVLDLNSVSLSDDFVDQGGDSISAILLSVALEEQGMRLTTADIMNFRLFEEMADRISVAEESSVELGEKFGHFNLLPVQQWFFAQNFVKPEHFNQAVMMKLPESVELANLASALTRLTQYHDAFWLRFHDSSQQTFSEMGDYHFELRELEELNWQHAEEEIAQLNTSFDLHTGPLLKGLLLRITDEQQPILYLCGHHLIVDGVSWRRISSDLQGFYEQGANFQPTPYTNTQGYRKHWDCFRYSDTEVDYWLSSGANISPKAELAKDVKRGHFILSEDETQSLLGSANQPYGTNTNELLISALYSFFGSKGRSFNLLLEGHGRKSFSDEVRCDATVGWFTSIFPLCLPKHDDTWQQLIKKTKQALRSLPSKGENFLAIAYGHNSEAVRNEFQSLLKLPISFNFLGRFGRGGDEAWQIEQKYNQYLVSEDNKPLRALDINAWVSDEKLYVEFDMVESAFQDISVEELSQNIHRSIQALLGHCTADDCLGGLTPSDLTDISLEQEVIENLEKQVGRLENIYPATDFQRELLYFNRVNPDYQIDQLYFELAGDLDEEAFVTAWNRALSKHDMLRAGFDDTYTEGTPLVLIPRHVELPLTWQDWQDKDWETEIQHAVLNERQRPFDWYNPPLLRLLLARTGESKHILLFTFHHVLFDGWSMQIFLREIRDDYEKLVKGEPLQIEQRSFIGFPRWLRAQPKEVSASFWQEYLCDAQMNMRFKPDNHGIDANALRIHSVVGALDKQQSEQFRSAAISHGATVNQFCQLAWAAMLSQYLDSSDIVFGTTMTNRPMDVGKVTELVGLFVATPPLRVHLEGPISQMVKKLNENNQQRIDHAFYDLNHYDDEWRPTAPFGTLFVFENYPEQKGEDKSSLTYRHLGTVSGTNHQIVLCLFPGESLGFSLYYDRSEISAELASQIANDYQAMLIKMIRAESAGDLMG
ncbi:hypothetical protein BS333_20010 [Vibrio azureus]|uniref:Carrier domain-containing protein n=1 Tax=Vibrio azureus NBRC 104587 TaxID=1219077 RepID=U3AQH6_9VIBR|nr:condensation domain-containing protein [Vibrio azureus]AUI88591.1 hypothetical protein BS333_20010 [Vibrio azureus]GAD76015.1 hypothetical protein VAZ01S_035_00220 [Vibrio azureus NBRC 104587]